MDHTRKVQSQIRHNADEMRDALLDLKNWEQDMKRKENTYRSDMFDDKDLPPVRSKAPKKVIKTKKTVKSEEKTTRISSYNYSAWDKFDADKACEELSSDSLDSEEEAIAMLTQKKHQSATEKDKGNEFFKVGKYEDAIKCYTKAVKCDPSNVIAFANRAQAYLKLKKYSEAEKDCNDAIKLDPKYVKAYLRRGTARLQLSKEADAANDFREVLVLEPRNSVAQGELSKLEKSGKQEETEKKVCEQSSGDAGNLLVQPIHKPPHLRSKKQLKRIEIQEIVESVPLPQTATKTIHIEEITSEEATSLTSLPSRSLPVKTSTKKDVSITCTTKPLAPIECPPFPKSTSQFQSAWETMSSHPGIKYQYLKNIGSHNYAKVFGGALEYDIFSDILKILHDQFIPTAENVYENLQGLSKVNRFSTLVMFLTSKDRAVLQDLISYCEQQGCSTDDVAYLKCKYEL